MATFSDILSSIWIQLLILFLGMLFGAVPTFKDLRKSSDEKTRPLNITGKILAIGLIIAFLISCVALYIDKRGELNANIKSEMRLKSDSISNLKLIQKVNDLIKNDSIYTAAIALRGYKYDRSKGIIISPHISKEGRIIINNGSSNENSHQNLGDIQVNRLWSMSANDKSKLLKLIAPYKAAVVKSCVLDDDTYHFTEEVRQFVEENGVTLVYKDNPIFINLSFQFSGFEVNPYGKLRSLNIDNLPDDAKINFCEILIGYKPKE